MKLLACAALQMVYWISLQAIVSAMKDDITILVAFAVTLAVSMVTAIVMLVSPR